MKVKASFRSLLKRVHSDEKGAVSLETILIIGAIALPALIFLLKVGWPKIRSYFRRNMDRVDNAPDQPW